MAIYHFTSKIIARSSGKSSVASAAYRAGEKFYDERQDKVVDYTKKQDVVFKEIFYQKQHISGWQIERSYGI